MPGNVEAFGLLNGELPVRFSAKATILSRFWSLPEAYAWVPLVAISRCAVKGRTLDLSLYSERDALGGHSEHAQDACNAATLSQVSPQMCTVEESTFMAADSTE